MPQAFAQDAGASSGTDALVQLGPGDGLNLSVYGQPDMGGPLVVSESGSISIPLVGTVSVKGLSPATAARRVEQALRDGQFLNDPHVTLTLTQELSQRVSVLGEVGKPGRYAIQNDTTLLDLIAQAGGITTAGGDVVYLLRTQQDGQVSRQEIKLGGFSRNQGTLVTGKLQAGDTYVVPKADTYYIYGQVTSPNMYRMESGMTVIQAVARAGGVTARGSEHRIEIKRTLPDGKVKTFGAGANDPVEPNDVIRVKESIF